MTHGELRKKFLEFFEGKGHKVVPSSSLIPDDPSVLFTTAGMQQFKKYYTAELDALKDFGTKNTVSIQKCFRTSDIDEVGDESHLTFFEMLGNFSFGGYFKKESIEYGYEFITKIMNLPIEYVSVFDPKKVPQGDWRKGVPFDEESYNFWKAILPEEKIKREGTDNFWGPTGNEGPCGPTTEIYVKSSSGKAIEIWNIVFNEFYRNSANNLKKLDTPGVDTGMGLERLAMVSQNVPTIFETDIFSSLMDKISEFAPKADARIKRILADHLRSSIFAIADGIRPSNKEAGYVLRRLLRRIMAFQIKYDIHGDLFAESVPLINKIYSDIYSEIGNSKMILEVLEEEQLKFKEAVSKGVKEIEKRKEISGADAFDIYQSYGLPFEVILELAPKEAIKNLNKGDFDAEFKKHQEISRAGVEKKFGGHGLVLNTGEIKAGNEEELQKVTRFHTATHLLNQALREVLGEEVEQRGSDITTERARFDFSFARKMTAEEIKKVEEIVNKKIEESLPVNFKEMPKDEAEKTGALKFFKGKYPEQVKVYYVGKSLESAWSKEFCGGPHVLNTAEIGKFKIIKEEASSAGIRRIRAVLVD